MELKSWFHSESQCDRSLGARSIHELPVRRIRLRKLYDSTIAQCVHYSLTSGSRRRTYEVTSDPNVKWLHLRASTLAT